MSAVATKQVSQQLSAAILRAANDPKISVSDLVLLAKMAKAEGADATSKALLARAKSRVEPTVSTSGRATEAPAITVPKASPISGVSSTQWLKFMEALKSGRAANAEEAGRIGDFAISVRRLADLGIVQNPKKTKTSWDAEWTNISKEKFTGSPELQEQALAKSLGDYAGKIRTDYVKAIGKSVNDKPITLSGLLGVAHVAGIKGLETWLRDGKVREKFPGTTKLFETTNGIF